MFKNPQTFKDGELIMGQYRIYDLIILLVGIVVSLLLVILTVTLGISRIHITVILIVFALIPGLLAYALVAKKKGFHNYLEFFKVLFYYQTKYLKKYQWEGVVLSDEDN